MQYFSLQPWTYFHHQSHPQLGVIFALALSLHSFLELFLHSSPVAYWASIDLGSSSFSVIFFCFYILFMGFSRPEYWSGLPFPSPGDLLDLGFLHCRQILYQLSYVEVIKIMVTSFKRSRACTAAFGASDPAAGHCWLTPLPDTPRHSQASRGQSLWVHCSFLLGPGAHKVYLWVLQEPISPVLCKFWQLCGGVNGDLLQEGLCYPQVCCTQSPCPCGRPLLSCASAGDTQILTGSISFSISLSVLFCSLPREATGSMMKVSLSISQWRWVLTLTWPCIPYWDKWASHALTRLGLSIAETLREIWRGLGACSRCGAANQRSPEAVL